MPEVLIALGSNLGDRLENLQSAVKELAGVARVTASSKIYETSPMYVEDQPSFYNAAVKAETSLGPLGLLKSLKALELSLGRMERLRNGPREIDLDLIAYGVLQYDRPGALTLPHPRTAERPFVLLPLRDVAPDWVLVGQGIVADLAAQTNSTAGNVVRIVDGDLPIHR